MNVREEAEFRKFAVDLFLSKFEQKALLTRSIEHVLADARLIADDIAAGRIVHHNRGMKLAKELGSVKTLMEYLWEQSRTTVFEDKKTDVQDDLVSKTKKKSP